MMAVDTSALMAILLDEPQSDACIAALEAESDIFVSPGTVAEALIVAARRNVGAEMTSIIDGTRIRSGARDGGCRAAHCRSLCTLGKGSGAEGRAQLRRLLRL